MVVRRRVLLAVAGAVVVVAALAALVAARTGTELAAARRLLDASVEDVGAADLREAGVHLHSSKAGLAGRLALRGRVPTVFQPHGWSFYAVTGATRRAAVVWERAGARWADRILCVSAGERARGSAARIRARWAVIPNGTDVEAIALPTERARAALRPRLGVGPGPLVVFVGRIDRAKGPDVLLDAWPAVTAAVPEARLMVVGEGPLLPALAARVPAGAGLAGHRDDPEAWLAAADVVAIPSRWEGMSLTMLDAMALGRPIVSADIPGAVDALAGGAGAVVPAEDPPALAAAIAERLLDPVAAAAEGRAARHRAETVFALRTALARTADLYRRVLADRRPGRPGG